MEWPLGRGLKALAPLPLPLPLPLPVSFYVFPEFAHLSPGSMDLRCSCRRRTWSRHDHWNKWRIGSLQLGSSCFEPTPCDGPAKETKRTWIQVCPSGTDPPGSGSTYKLIERLSPFLNIEKKIMSLATYIKVIVVSLVNWFIPHCEAAFLFIH